MNHPKYIVWERKSDGVIFATLFHPVLTHATMAIADCKPLSAGFFAFGAEGEISAFGESVTMRLKANGAGFDDRKLIARALGLDPEKVVRD